MLHLKGKVYYDDDDKKIINIYIYMYIYIYMLSVCWRGVLKHLVAEMFVL